MKINIRDGFEPVNSVSNPCIQVVIDVFRASTTALALLEVGVSELVVANDIETIKRFHSIGYKIISEVFDLGIDNSPTLVLKGSFKGERTLLKTSNLTTAISDNFSSKSQMLIGGFNNITALAEYIKEQKPDWIEIVPAGLMQAKLTNPEDNECAFLLKSLLQGEKYEPDWRSIHEKIDRKILETDRPQFYIDDLYHSLKFDFTTIVPFVEKVSDSSFKILPS